ncbi:hypothetical protein [Sphingomonas jaspsi]|uniref:hypothetical protein n=1 Tax=Sphingomonas jaspsi TaxID=392409 RepID=UPI0004BAC579|nr:hypothetical protein [Sphingomonas jaspsi]
MNRMMTAAVAVAIMTLGGCKQHDGSNETAAGAAAAAATSIDGTWKADLASVKFENKPEEWSIKDGLYNCPTCLPTPYKDFKADGAFHPVADRPTFDNLSITVADDKTVKMVRQKAGKEVGHNEMSVSADGKTLTNNWTALNNANGKETSGSAMFSRVGDAPAGAHAVSGQWAVNQAANISPEALTATYKLEGDVLNATFGTGESYSAKLDGSDTPVKGDAAGGTVAVVREGAGYKLTGKVGGKTTDLVTFTPASDGTMDVTSIDPRDNSKVSYKLVRQ